MIYFYLIGLLWSIIAETISLYVIYKSRHLQTFEEYAKTYDNVVFDIGYILFMMWCLFVTTNPWLFKLALFTIVIGVISTEINKIINETHNRLFNEDDKSTWQTIMLIDTVLCLLALIVMFVLVCLNIASELSLICSKGIMMAPLTPF